jgi:hypothetical protein
VITILRGKIRSRALGGAWEVRGTPVDFHAQQIVVGVSIAIDSVLTFDDDLPILPAILDTGLNQSFSIHQYHLEESAGIPKQTLAHFISDQKYLTHEYDICSASLWLHRMPFERNNNGSPTPPPLFLGKSNHTIVYKYKKHQLAKHITDNAVFPRLPCLGMKALTENHLRFFVEGKGDKSYFRVSRSFKSWLYAGELW